MKHKKILSILLTLTMLCSLAVAVTVPASAADSLSKTINTMGSGPFISEPVAITGTPDTSGLSLKDGATVSVAGGYQITKVSMTVGKSAGQIQEMTTTAGSFTQIQYGSGKAIIVDAINSSSVTIGASVRGWDSGLWISSFTVYYKALTHTSSAVFDVKNAEDYSGVNFTFSNEKSGYCLLSDIITGWSELSGKVKFGIDVTNVPNGVTLTKAELVKAAE